MAQTPTDPRRSRERTCFKTRQPYSPDLDVGADVVIVYDSGDSSAERIRSWIEAGYVCHFMLGAGWGWYDDYLYGRWDGEDHTAEIQTRRDQMRIGREDEAYYLCPTESLAAYLAERAAEALEAGAEAIHFHEPEFWAHAGHSEAFKRAWREHYGTEWVPPHESTDSRYRASRLMRQLYRDLLESAMRRVRESAGRLGREVRCYVATHSLLNYAHWRLVSPESLLTEIEECDGFIGQVWTGSARTPVGYRGVVAEHTFELAFLEYGALVDLARAGGHRLWFMMDPVEDDPFRTWEDYRRNWEATVVAAAMWPEVWRYEVMQWPERVLRDEHTVAGGHEVRPIPPEYATEALTVTNALADLNRSEWEWRCGTQGVGLLVSDSMMFQREDPSPSDERLGFIYGLGLPLVRSGIPVQPVQMEHVCTPGHLEGYDILFLTYEGQKPPSVECHEALRDWVRAGGVLVYVGHDADPYHGVLEWWNTGDRSYASPREHLFETLGLHPDAHSGVHRVRKGGLVHLRHDPSDLAASHSGPDTVIRLVRDACRRRNFRFDIVNHLILRRGPYVIAAGVDGLSPEEPVSLGGPMVDLFDARLPVLDSVELRAGDIRMLLDIARVEGPTDRVLCSASRIQDQERWGQEFRFKSTGPEGTVATTRVRLSARPGRVSIGGCDDAIEATWHAGTRSLLLRYPNLPGGREVRIVLGAGLAGSRGESAGC